MTHTTETRHSYVVAHIKGRDYLTVADAADYLNLSEKTVYNLVNDKRASLESAKWGRQIVIEIESLRAEKARREAPQSEVAN